MVIVFKFCGSKNLDHQGHMVIGIDRTEDCFKHLLDHKVCTCEDCHRTFTYIEKDEE